MKKKLLVVLGIITCFPLFSANYFVQLGSGNAAAWDPVVVTANSGILVNLQTEAKTFNEWYTATFTSVPQELSYIYVACGTYKFTDRFNYQDSVHIYGGYNGTSLTRNEGGNPWDFQDETIFDGNNYASRHLYGGNVARNNVIIEGITFTKGGGTAGAALTLRGNTILRRCKLIDNSNDNASGSNGAAIYLYGGGSVRNCYFDGNKNNGSKGNGGDIGVSNSGYTNVIDGNKFINSYAAYRGAVLCVAGASTVVFSNNLIINSTGSSAVVIVSTASAKPTVNIINNTFANNTVSSIHVSGQTDGYPNLKIYNCVFWSNSTFGGGLGKVSGSADSNTIIKNCALMEANPSSWTSENNFILENTNTGELPGAKYPVFVDPEKNDFRITQASALFNSGAEFEDLPNLIDFFGTPRPQESNPDIGFHEFFKSTGLSAPVAMKLLHYVADGQLFISNIATERMDIMLFNSAGEMVKSLILEPDAQQQIPLQTGIYFICIASHSAAVKAIVP